MLGSLDSHVAVCSRARVLLRVLSTGIFLCSLTGVAQAVSIPPNLGNGLDKIVQAKSKNPAFHNIAEEDQGNALFDLAITDAQGRVLVRVNPSGITPGKPIKNIRTLGASLAASISSLQVTAVDENYHKVGVMNAWVSPEDVVALATSADVRSVILELKPRHNRAGVKSPAASSYAMPGNIFNKLGTTYDSGVTQHHVDQINQLYNPGAPVDYEGQGMSIGFISNSYAAHTANPVSIDVNNFDLPGALSNPVNTQPVVVLQDDLSDATSDDEGRGMIQIGYKMAPKARLAFATADFGEVGFANNIRALAGISGFVNPDPLIQQGFAADTICDDVSYPDEPFYEDGIIGAAVNDAAAYGAAYFSSAANDIGTNGYESVIRLVPNGTGLTAATNSALAGTNINLTGVPPALFAGGFHNFNPNPGQLDVAQTVNVSANNTVQTVLQWNDPYDQNGGAATTGTIYTNTGNFIATPVIFDGSSTPPLPTFVAGQGYSIIEQATGGSNFDAIVTLIDPNGNTLLTQDTGINETVNFTAQMSGQYKLSYNHFKATTGTFSVTVDTANITPLVMSDWNLLAFRTDTGAYVAASSLTTDNIASNEPIEIGFVNRTSPTILSIQYVLARANTPPAGAQLADHIRYLMSANGLPGFGPAEYFSYNTVTTAGHAMANGSNGVAAYGVFRPSLPEVFTSPGPVTIYFDSQQNRLALPEVRRQPRLAAIDGANVSHNMNGYFTQDNPPNFPEDPEDLDTDGNFYGTSAAAPHAAAIAALVLQAHGGHHSVTPAQMTDLLERSTFLHDLDPSYASATAFTNGGDKVKITISSDGSNNPTSGIGGAVGTGGADANAFSIAYNGSGHITTLVFNPQGTALTGGNVSGGNNGYQDVTPATMPPTLTYFENNFPGMVFTPSAAAPQIIVGSGSAIPLASVTPTFSNPAPTPSIANQWWTMTLTFDSTFTSGKVFRYNVNRGVQHSAVVTNGLTSTGGSTTVGNAAGSATFFVGDLLGGGVSLPAGIVAADGMTFSGTTSTGGTFSGVIRNRLGHGYSPVDGYGLIDAQTAVGQTVQ